MNGRSYRTAPGLWVLDLAFLLLGGLLLFLVTQFLRTDEPNLIFNAWTYLLGVPTALFIVSMLTHVLSNDYVERSLQIGLLASVIAHLLLVLGAVHWIIFEGMGPAALGQGDVLVKREVVRPPVYYQPAQNSLPEEKPDYLKPVPTETPEYQRNSQAEKQKSVDSPIEIDVVQQELKSDLQKKSAELEPAMFQPNVPDIQSNQRPLERETSTADAKLDSLPIDAPNTSIQATASEPNLTPASIDAKPSNMAAKSTPSLPADFLPNSASSFSQSDPRIPPSPRAPSTDVNRLAQELDRSLEAMGREADSRAPVNRNQLSAGASQSAIAANSIAVPQTSLDAQPADSYSPAERMQPKNARMVPAASSLSGASATLSRESVPLPSNQAASRSSASAAALDSRMAQKSGPSLSSAPALANDSRLAMDRLSAPSSARPVAPSSQPLSQGIGEPRVPLEPGAGAPSASSGPPSESAALAALQRSAGSIGKSNTRADLKSAAPTSMENGLALQPAMTELGKVDVRRSLTNRSTEVRMPDLQEADFSPERFRRPTIGGPKIASSNVPVPTPAFSQRIQRIRERESQASSSLGPLGPQTELAIERGLEFLARHQRQDGSWHLEDFGEQVRMQSNTAATALALLSFQGAGYTHKQFKYEPVCNRAVEYLKRVQKSNGDLYERGDSVSDANAWLYSHAIATLALCEAYGMTQDEELRSFAQKGVDFLVESQDPDGGGWRYTPKYGSDTSVTGWVMMAFKSAELAGLEVNKNVYRGIQRWIENSQVQEAPYLYRYNWQANTTTSAHGRVPTPVMTSVGLLMRLYTGWKRDNANMQLGTTWLLDHRPAVGTSRAPARDTYYWYYATQVMFHAGGEKWKSWYGDLYPILIQSQVTEGEMVGSWEPLGEIPDAWGEYGGRLYVTTLNLLSLEVYYRHLPLYEATAQ